VYAPLFIHHRLDSLAYVRPRRRESESWKEGEREGGREGEREAGEREMRGGVDFHHRLDSLAYVRPDPV